MNPETTRVWHPLRDQLTGLRQQQLRAGRAPIHFERLETVGGDVPDLSWAMTWPGFGEGEPGSSSDLSAEGHIELKHRADWPARGDTPVVVQSVTSGQRLWWRQRWEAGGNAHVLLRVGLDWLLLPGLWAALNLGTAPGGELLGASLLRDPRHLDAQEVLRACRR